MPAVSFDFSLAPKQALEYLNNKGYKLSFDYDELAPSVHHQAFTVAKVTRLDLLHDIFNSLETAYKDGVPFDEWKANIEPTLAKKGWLGKTEVVNPKTGEVKTIDVNARRLRTIFDTNKRVAYAVQRYQSQQGLTHSVYWRYRSMLLPTTREKHRVLHGTTLHRDDPFWLVNYPPNEWGCICTVQAYSERQLARRGIEVSSQAPESIAGKDWSHDIGKGSRVARLTKMDLADDLPTIMANPDLDKLTDDELKARFYQNLGVKEGEMIIDKVGDPTWIDEDLFKANVFSKLRKRKRHLYFDSFAQVIKDPDEIYLELETIQSTGKTRLVKKMFKYFEDEKGKRRGIMAIFEYQKDKTQGVSIYAIDNEVGTERRRTEKLIYKK